MVGWAGYGDPPLPAPNAPPQPANARIRFGTWEEFARFLNQEGSERGLFLRAANPPPIGTELTVQFVLPDGSELLLPARVAQALGPLEAEAVGSEPGMGVQFTHMSEEQALRLQQLMANALQPTDPAERDPRLDQVTAWLERSRFDLAERKLKQMLAERPGNAEARLLLHLTQARKARGQFEFELAIENYRALLQLDPRNTEAREQLEVLRDEAERSKAMFERVFGRR